MYIPNALEIEKHERLINEVLGRFPRARKNPQTVRPRCWERANDLSADAEVNQVYRLLEK